MADVGIKFEATNYEEFQKNLKNIQLGMKQMGSELKEVKSQFDKNDTSVDALTKKNEALEKSIKAQKDALAFLSSGIEAAKEEYGENSEEVKKATIQYNDAKTTLNKLTREYDDNAKAIDEVGDKTEDAGEKADKAGGKLSGFGKVMSGVAKAAAVAVAAVAASVVAIGKKAVESYSEYEQLVGGVDTLFGDSSAKVQEYAANAYKTAGMSANDYMSTVTSFSASLLQSLGGDTEAAAAAADMAITDMSDNANKMGTDIGSIQYAYQGFAKQNYTMLDNLKLGYGGTKTEMERLLQDAEKLSGRKYDLSSLNDVYEAIHVVQTELEITGTTAKEASTTIEGSMNSMKAAWSNFLTGLGKGEDISAVTENLINSIGTVVENLIPVIGNVIDAIFSSIKEFIINKLPEMAQNGADAINSFAESILKNGIDPDGETMKAVSEVIAAILKSLGTLLLSLLNLGAAALKELGKGIKNGFEEILKKIGGWIRDNIIAPIEKKFTDFFNVGKNIINKVRDGISNAWESLKKWFNGLWDSLFGNKKVNVSVGKAADAGIPGFATGLNYVPYDNFLARLHKGEMVVPSNIAETLRSNTMRSATSAPVTTSAPANHSTQVQSSPINITVQSILDGKIIGESVTRYQNTAAKRGGLALVGG